MARRRETSPRVPTGPVHGRLAGRSNFTGRCAPSSRRTSAAVRPAASIAAASAPLDVPTNAAGCTLRSSSAAAVPACDEKHRNPDDKIRSYEVVGLSLCGTHAATGMAEATRSSLARKDERCEGCAGKGEREHHEARVWKEVGFKGRRSGVGESAVVDLCGWKSLFALILLSEQWRCTSRRCGAA